MLRSGAAFLLQGCHSLLRLAIKNNDLPMCKWLTDYCGIPLDLDIDMGSPPFVVACEYPHTTILEWMLNSVDGEALLEEGNVRTCLAVLCFDVGCAVTLRLNAVLR